MAKRKTSNKRLQARIARQEARKQAIQLAEDEIDRQVEYANEYIASISHLIAPGDIFVSRGYYGHLLTYNIQRIYTVAPHPETVGTRKLPDVKIFVEYVFSREGDGYGIARKYPLNKFLFNPVHGNTYRVKAVRPLREYKHDNDHEFDKPIG
ncbi:hypothetical protein [Vibrio phage vB_VneS_J26]